MGDRGGRRSLLGSTGRDDAPGSAPHAAGRGEPNQAINGQTDTAALVAMLSERAAVNVRLALVADEQQWRLHHGQVTLDDDTPLKERAWRYSTATFLELCLPRPTVAALLRGDDQDVHDIHVVFPGPPPLSASTPRLRGQEEWDRVTTPWPRTEWTISRDPNAPQPGYGLLVGDGPSEMRLLQLRTLTGSGAGGI